MLAYTKRKFLELLRLDFVRFCIVGGLGFVINFILLVALHSLVGMSAFFSQLFAAEVALLCNFMLHNHWTYARHRVAKSVPTLLIQFHASTWPAIVGSAVLVALGEGLLHLSNLVALALSSTIALGWNFAWSKYVIWRDVSKKEIKEIAELH